MKLGKFYRVGRVTLNSGTFFGLMQGIFDFFGFLWLFGQNLTKIARGPQLKIFESGVSVLQHAVIYETHLFSAIIVF